LIELRAGWIVLQTEEDERASLTATSGLPEEIVRAHVQCIWTQCICSEILDLKKPRVFQELPEHWCPTADFFAKEGWVFRACIPLTAKDRVLGVMTLVGDEQSGVQRLSSDLLEMLTAIGRQIGMAVENASLYAELREQEMVRRLLLERVIGVQEEERKRIALELHDQTGQPLTSLIMRLGFLAEATSLSQVHDLAQDLRDTAADVLRQVHDLALELRPSVLDDLGLLAALRYHHKEFESRFHLPVDFQVVGLEDRRLPSDIEIALYRIVQEALTNVARHAEATNVSVLLEHRGAGVKLIVEDDGKGFDVSQGAGLHQERLGLYSMRERAALLGGTVTIESSPGTGTALFVELPLDGGDKCDEQDAFARC
jgi:signal transduction histidine kinase